MREPESGPGTANGRELSDAGREKRDEVIGLAARGKSDWEISDKLGVPPQDVDGILHDAR